MALLLAGDGDAGGEVADKREALPGVKRGQGLGGAGLEVAQEGGDLLPPPTLGKELLAIVLHGEVPNLPLAVFGAKLAHSRTSDRS